MRAAEIELSSEFLSRKNAFHASAREEKRSGTTLGNYIRDFHAEVARSESPRRWFFFAPPDFYEVDAGG